MSRKMTIFYSSYVFCHKNGRPHRDVRVSLDKAARQARIEVVEALARRMDTKIQPCLNRKSCHNAAST